MPTIPLSNLSKGEIAPALQARIDTAQYAAGAKRVRNFILQRYGGAAFRPGFRFVAEVDDIATEQHYIPFQYNIEQAYIMVLDDEFMRLLATGGQVIEQNLAITAITKAVNAQVTAAYHDYVVGDRLYFSGITGMTELNGREAVVASVVDADNFTIDLDTTNFSTFVSATGDTRVGAPTPVVPPPPPPVPPDPPPPADTTDYGGSGGDLGEYSGWQDYRYGWYY